MGRKKAVIDWRRVDQLLMAQCGTSEIAESQGVSPETLHRACRREHKIDFEAYSRQKKTRGVTFAKEKFYQQAWIENGDPKSQTTKQIFWLKNHAGWSDKPSFKDDEPKDEAPKQYELKISLPDGTALAPIHNYNDIEAALNATTQQDPYKFKYEQDTDAS